MTPYRIARRAFIRSVGAGAVGLKVFLRNIEASAQGAKSPPRFLMTHWPVGTQKYWYVPITVGSDPNPAGTAIPTQAPNGTNWDFSRILKPFGDAGLKNDMIVLYGLNNGGVGAFGGGHEAGTPQSTTGARTPGTRANGGETDDAVSGGPSWDQIFLKLVPDLYRANSGVGYINTICDARVDSQETSTQCLSYDYKTQSTPAAQGGSGGSVVENAPLTPILSPIQAYNKLFMNIGGGGTVTDTARLLKARKSVLDAARTQLARLKSISPASESSKIDQHAEAVRKIEDMLTAQINMPGTGMPGTCTPPMAPDPALSGKNTRINSDYKTPGQGATTATVDDSVTHDLIGRAHMGIIRTAFQCDLLRVATFQWSPGTNHVSFKGLYPGNTNIYMHHPTSHQITAGNLSLTSPSGATAQQLEILNFLANVQTWYNQRMADLITTFKTTTDVLGGNLLDNTIIPYITEVAETSHSKSTLPGMIFGGKALGMRGGQWLQQNRPHNDLWLTIAQAYFKTTNPLSMLPATNTDGTLNTFVRTGAAPIAGMWAAPV